ncbi:MAG: hypothetical protein AAGF12_03140 [Myxococcota bacterium]
MAAKRPLTLSFLLSSLILIGMTVLPATGQPPTESEEPALPTETIVVDAQLETTSRIAIPDLIGAAPHAAAGGEVLRNDFTLMPGYRVVGPNGIQHDTDAEGLNLRASNWRSLNLVGVIKGEVTPASGGVRVQMRFWRANALSNPAVEHTYTGSPERLRRYMHHFGNKVLLELTGKLGPFGTKLAFARRIQPGRKDVMCAHMDGHNVLRVSNGRGIAMLPSFSSDGHIWFTRLTRVGMFITRSATRGRRIIEGNGLNMAPSICGNRIFFVSSRDGNSEIYSSDMNGRDLRRLTNNPAIDVSPSCGPNGKVAFVSSRHGSPQIFWMNADGTQQDRVTYRGAHNQTPSFCQDPNRPLIAFTGRDGNLDIFTVNPTNREIIRVTQGTGNNKDPAFSPDCRMIAFASDRRRAPGVYLSSPLGFEQNRVVEGQAETLSWGTHRLPVD